MTSGDALEALARLAEIAFVGRVILSLCPPGMPGRHGPRDLFATWGACHVLGGIALAAEARAAELLGLDLPGTSLAAPWLLAACLRWITLPGAMVPRHEPLAENPGAIARALAAAAPLAVVLGVMRATNGDSDRSGIVHVAIAADAIALLACVSFALAAARRAPTARAIAVLLFGAGLGAAIAFAQVQAIPLALGMACGAAFGAVWLRRGDRRAAVLSGIAFAGCGLLGAREALFGAAGLCALWVHTPGPSKRWILVRSLVALGIGTALGGSRYDPFAPDPPVFSWMTTAVLVVVPLALWRRKRLADARLLSAGAEPLADGRIESTRAQRDFVRDALLLAVVPLASRGELSSLEGLLPALLPLAPMVLLDLGLALAPPEQPLGGAAPEPGGVRR